MKNSLKDKQIFRPSNGYASKFNAFITLPKEILEKSFTHTSLLRHLKAIFDEICMKNRYLINYILLLNFNFIFGCPNGTIKHKFWCYKVMEIDDTFENAVGQCRNWGGSIMTIENQEEFDKLGIS